MNLRQRGYVFEQADTEFDDSEDFGMDAMTQKRLRVKRLHKPKQVKKPKRPFRNKMPYSLRTDEE